LNEEGVEPGEASFFLGYFTNHSSAVAQWRACVIPNVMHVHIRNGYVASKNGTEKVAPVLPNTMWLLHN